MNSINRFFWLCSGSSLSIIKRSPTEGSKYAGIGATIFFTGLFAALSATYAFQTVFENYWISIGSGLLWGSMIFNLDRYIVSSMRKRGSRSSEFLMASPRIVLALLIAIVISKPLELKIFEKEVNNELVIMQQELRKEQENKVRDRFSNQMLGLQTQMEGLRNEISEKETIRDRLNEEAIKEADGTGGTGLRNAGPIYRLKKSEADNAARESSATKLRNDSLMNRNQMALDSLSNRVAQEISGLEAMSYNGFAARLESLNRIGEDSSAIYFAHLFIIFLFIAIETAPIFVKLISTKGPFDDRLEVHEHYSHSLRTQQMAMNSESARKKGNALNDQEKNWVERELGKSLR